MNFTLTGSVVKADTAEPFEEGTTTAREVVVQGSTTGGDPFEVTLRVPRDLSPDLFDPLGTAGLGDSVTVEVTL